MYKAKEENSKKTVKQNNRIKLVLSSVAIGINGDTTVTSVDIKNLKTDKIVKIDVDGVFVFIGQQPMAYPFNKLLPTDSEGFLIADESTATSLPGVFAAGDIRAKAIRQIATAISDGAVAAKMAVRYIQEVASD